MLISNKHSANTRFYSHVVCHLIAIVFGEDTDDDDDGDDRGGHCREVLKQKTNQQKIQTMIKEKK